LTDPTWFQIVPAKAQTEGSLWYDHIYNPRDFKQKKGAAYRTPPNPSCIPEFFGDTMLCNGTVYPLLEVDPKRYRFFVLNACNARFLNINVLQANPKNVDGIDLHLKTLFPLNPPGPDIIQLGTEGGFLTREVRHVSPKPFSPITLKGNLLLGPAERADIIIDFTGQEGKEFILYNDAPGPFPAGPPTTDYYLGNPKNPIQPTTIRDKSTGQKWSTGPDTRQILRIRVSNAAVSDPQPPGPILDEDDIEPALLSPIPRNTAGPIPPLAPPNSATLRQLTLNEDFDEYGRLRQALGTFAPNKTGTRFGLEYLDPATETPAAGAVEVWDIFNLTADTHPIHFHLVNVQVLSRQPFTTHGGLITPAAAARGPEPEEWGWKETVQMHPSEVTRVTMKFALPDVPFAVPGSPRATEGTVPDASRKYHEYVWHCHILEHEEHDMMRPIFVEEPPKP
jgi:spore coat protein A